MLLYDCTGDQAAFHALGDVFAFDAEDPEEAYGKLDGELVENVTRDFRATWARR